MLRRIALFCIPVTLLAQTYSRYANFSADLAGLTDVRAGTYGTTDKVQQDITFAPPAGYGVRVLEIRGDLVTWIKTLPGEPGTPLESTAGLLLGIQSTPQSPDPPALCDWCSAMALRFLVHGTTMLYIQDRVTEKQPSSRASYDVRVNQLLQADNKLLITIASWLNTTGKPIHVEPTFQVIFQWEKQK